jgi:hypothetical protein
MNMRAGMKPAASLDRASYDMNYSIDYDPHLS